MALLQDFYPMPLGEEIPRAGTVHDLAHASVWRKWNLRSLSIADIDRGYVLAPTPYAREIVDYVIRNKDKIQQLKDRWLYFLRSDNPSLLWPPPVNIEEELIEDIQLPRLYGKLTIEAASTLELDSLGARANIIQADDETLPLINPERGQLTTNTNTILTKYPVQFYGVGGLIDNTIPFSHRYGLPKNESIFVTAFGENSDERLAEPIFYFETQQVASDHGVSIYWSNTPKYFRQQRRVIPTPETISNDLPSRNTAVNTWFRLLDETMTSSTEDHVLVLTVLTQWEGHPLSEIDIGIPFRMCPILRIRVGDVIDYKIYLGDLGWRRSLSVPRVLSGDNLGMMRWPMVLPASTEDQTFRVDVWFPEISDDDRALFPRIMSNIRGVAYNFRSPQSLIKQSLLWNDLTIWPQGPTVANIIGTPVRVPKGSTFKDNNNNDLLIDIPSGWTISSGFDHLRTSDPVWIGIDILLRSGIPLSDIDWESAAKTSRLVDEPVGVVVDDAINSFNELRIKPVFVNGLWRFSSDVTKTIKLSQMQTIPKISITRPEPPPRTIGVPYKPMKFIEVTRESNQSGYQTIHVVDTLNKSEAIKEGRRYLWPETSYTIQVILTNSIDIIVNDYIDIPETNRIWKVESIRRTSTAQSIIALWNDPDRERYIETGVEPTVGDFIDDWGFLDLHGFVDA